MSSVVAFGCWLPTAGTQHFQHYFHAVSSCLCLYFALARVLVFAFATAFAIGNFAIAPLPTLALVAAVAAAE